MWSSFSFLMKGLKERFVLSKSLEQIKAIQKKRLQHLVGYAKQHSPFYADFYRSVDPNHFDLHELPVLTKAIMMDRFEDFLTDRTLNRHDLEEFMEDPHRLGTWFRDRYAVSHTSGSSGLQAIIVQDRSMLELLFALQMLRGSPLSLSPGAIFDRLFRKTRVALITVSHTFLPSASAMSYFPKAASRFVDRIWINKIHPLEELVEQLNTFQPEIIIAYAHVLDLLAPEVLAGRLLVGVKHPLKQVINMSEPLSEGARQQIEQAFKLPVTDNYAMGECMALTTGCLKGRGMHVQADWAMLEVVDENNKAVPDGQPGEKVLITNLYNTLQPFIRYEIHDVVTLDPKPCHCGSPLPHILQVEGRTDEVVWIRDRGQLRRIHPYVFVDTISEFPAVGWYQVVQKQQNHFLVRAASAPHRSFDVADLRELFKSRLPRFGLDGVINLDIVKDETVAPDQYTGKLKRITSELSSAQPVELV